MHLWWVWKDVIWKVRLSHRCQLRNLYLNSAPGCLTRRPFSKGKPFSKEWGLTLTQPTQPDTNLNSYGISKTRTWTLNYCHINYRRNGRVEHRRALGHLVMTSSTISREQHHWWFFCNVCRKDLLPTSAFSGWGISHWGTTNSLRPCAKWGPT
jgi:hypothetical protein